MRNASRAITSEPQWTAASDEKNLSTASKNERNESPAASGRAMAPTLRGVRAGQPQDGAKGLVGSRPVLVNQLWARRLHHRAERQADQNRVVELAGDRNEVRHQVDRGDEIGRQQGQWQLAA